jgi:hypothetical protein
MLLDKLGKLCCGKRPSFFAKKKPVTKKSFLTMRLGLFESLMLDFRIATDSKKLHLTDAEKSAVRFGGFGHAQMCSDGI